ncbi:tetratricopeptide repeat protein 33 [Polypterus senegalus]|uniref:tetratricopeptide repeat protein 33 n=1 Tax=Polypterus senegalus TaxID=55291 RepID=UPI00196246BE|nr:tetratricopeptide repeat protein 33 [Polypterus senegalus]XP_039606566.1 tetratricopeptide repeat protein 33 [Polypterus senegalus]
MASFGWKRKAGEKVSKLAVQQFEANETDNAQLSESGEVDWLHGIKRRREVLLEDCAAKSKRLKEEGAFLVQNGRHWEAIGKFDEAIQLTPADATLYEMKSQVLMILHEVFPAVQAAETAVRLNPRWWEAWQTLGRAQLNLGEINLALKSFQIAIHIFPGDRSLWEDDLSWAQHLKEEKRAVEERGSLKEQDKKEITVSPALIPDYDFESDEVVAACVAIAEKQNETLQKKSTAVFVALNGSVEVVSNETQSCETVVDRQFVSARMLHHQVPHS